MWLISPINDDNDCSEKKQNRMSHSELYMQDVIRVIDKRTTEMRTLSRQHPFNRFYAKMFNKYTDLLIEKYKNLEELKDWEEQEKNRFR